MEAILLPSKFFLPNPPTHYLFIQRGCAIVCFLCFVSYFDDSLPWTLLHICGSICTSYLLIIEIGFFMCLVNVDCVCTFVSIGQFVGNIVPMIDWSVFIWRIFRSDKHWLVYCWHMVIALKKICILRLSNMSPYLTYVWLIYVSTCQALNIKCK